MLRILEQHNNEQDNKKGRERNKSPFLLGPYLFQAIYSVEQKKTAIKGMPVLMRRPAELRAHFHEASAKARALARLLRKGPQPSVALAAHDEAREAVTPFQPFPTVQSPHRSETVKPLAELLDTAAASLDSMPEKILSAQQRAKSGARFELQRLAASTLVRRFRKELNRPYHLHVAAIVTALSGIHTDADYVKKIEKRNLPATALRGQSS